MKQRKRCSRDFAAIGVTIGGLPLPTLVWPIGIIAALAVAMFCPQHTPRYYWVMAVMMVNQYVILQVAAYAGFVLSMLCIYLLASEVRKCIKL